MRTGQIKAITSHLPAAVLTSDALAELYPGWTAEKIVEKTGVRERRIAAADETATDLGEAAARKLIDETGVDPATIDFLIFCTQTPDYPLPGNANLLHHRLGLRRECGSFDYAIGCAGYVYGLALVEGLIASGSAERVLLITCDTYSKLIHPMDRSVRTLFGDAATATLIEADDQSERTLGPFIFGTDGAGAKNLIVPVGGARAPRPRVAAEPGADRVGDMRGPANLFMDGAEVLAFALKTVPAAAAQLMARTGRGMDDYDLVVLHQASALLLDRLQRKLGVDDDRFVRRLEYCGNTVSSTIPLALEPYAPPSGQPRRCLLIGFGVGYSWAAGEILI